MSTEFLKCMVLTPSSNFSMPGKFSTSPASLPNPLHNTARATERHHQEYASHDRTQCNTDSSAEFRIVFLQDSNFDSARNQSQGNGQNHGEIYSRELLRTMAEGNICILLQSSPHSA